MELSEELLRLSRPIAEAGDAGGVSLRRAVSTAYYAAFHLLTTNAARRLAPMEPERLRFRLCRMFDHMTVHDTCKLFTSARLREVGEGLIVSPVETGLTDLARSFSELREARMTADYDLSFNPTRICAEEAIQMTERVFKDWDSVRESPNAAVFMAALAFPKLLARRR